MRLQEEVLTDIRNTETQTYPIVKIGIQYWMGRSLEATHYTDGKAITLKKILQQQQPDIIPANTLMPFKVFISIIVPLSLPVSYHLRDGRSRQNQIGSH